MVTWKHQAVKGCCLPALCPTLDLSCSPRKTVPQLLPWSRPVTTTICWSQSSKTCSHAWSEIGVRWTTPYPWLQMDSAKIMVFQLSPLQHIISVSEQWSRRVSGQCSRATYGDVPAGAENNYQLVTWIGKSWPHVQICEHAVCVSQSTCGSMTSTQACTQEATLYGDNNIGSCMHRQTVQGPQDICQTQSFLHNHNHRTGSLPSKAAIAVRSRCACRLCMRCVGGGLRYTHHSGGTHSLLITTCTTQVYLRKVPYHANDVGNTAKHTSKGWAYNCLLSRHMCFTLPFGDTVETTMQPVRDMLGRIRKVPCSNTWTDISPSTFWGFMEQCVCAGGEALLHFIDGSCQIVSTVTNTAECFWHSYQANWAHQHRPSLKRVLTINWIGADAAEQPVEVCIKETVHWCTSWLQLSMVLWPRSSVLHQWQHQDCV